MAVMSATIAAIVLAVADLDAAGVWQPEFVAAEVSVGHVTIYGGGRIPLQTVTANSDQTATLLKADGSRWTVSGSRPSGGLSGLSDETAFFACGAEFCREFMIAESDGTGALQQWGLTGMHTITGPNIVELIDTSGRLVTVKLRRAEQN